MTDKILTWPRRSFLSRLSTAAAAAGASLVGAATVAHASQDTRQRWAPQRHPQDDWFDEIPGRHRFFYDTETPNGAGEAITFATNYYVANKSGYDLNDGDLAVVICLRHWSTPFAWTDPMWAKYGAPISERIQFADPRTKEPPKQNVYLHGQYGSLLPNRGTTLDVLIRRGVRFAVCDMAARAYAGIIAGKLGLKADDVYADLRANSIANCHYVPAGIVAVARAQERGYALVQHG
jgi:intracellular sulfur oxidation DsrE/DsrF family protein